MSLARLSVVIAVIASVACSGGGSTGPTGSTGGTGGTGGNGGNGGQCPAGTVCFLSSTYSPTSLTVAAGTTVTFNNSSGIGHTVNFDGTRPPGVADIELNTSGTFDRRFNDVGTWKFHCTQHAGMTGQIVVQ